MKGGQAARLFYLRAAGIELLPENPDFKIIKVDPEADEFAIEGLAVGLMRSWH